MAIKEFPGWFFHPTRGQVLCKTPNDLAQLGPGWSDSPDFKGADAPQVAEESEADKKARELREEAERLTAEAEKEALRISKGEATATTDDGLPPSIALPAPELPATTEKKKGGRPKKAAAKP